VSGDANGLLRFQFCMDMAFPSLDLGGDDVEQRRHRRLRRLAEVRQAQRAQTERRVLIDADQDRQQATTGRIRIAGDSVIDAVVVSGGHGRDAGSEIERRQLPGVIRVRRRVLLRADDLLDWLNQKRAPSPKE